MKQMILYSYIGSVFYDLRYPLIIPPKIFPWGEYLVARLLPMICHVKIMTQLIDGNERGENIQVVLHTICCYCVKTTPVQISWAAD